MRISILFFVAMIFALPLFADHHHPNAVSYTHLTLPTKA